MNWSSRNTTSITRPAAGSSIRWRAWRNAGERRNTAGTFTFASLEAYAAGQPTTFTRNTGNPEVEIAQAQLGLYVQDDIRVRKDLTLSAGLRQEYQSNIGGFHLAPRAGLAWSPFRSGRTTIRGGGGVFFDWFDAVGVEDTRRGATALLIAVAEEAVKVGGS